MHKTRPISTNYLGRVLSLANDNIMQHTVCLSGALREKEFVHPRGYFLYSFQPASGFSRSGKVMILSIEQAHASLYAIHLQRSIHLHRLKIGRAHV